MFNNGVLSTVTWILVQNALMVPRASLMGKKYIYSEENRMIRYVGVRWSRIDILPPSCMYSFQSTERTLKRTQTAYSCLYVIYLGVRQIPSRIHVRVNDRGPAGGLMKACLNRLGPKREEPKPTKLKPLAKHFLFHLELICAFRI